MTTPERFTSDQARALARDARVGLLPNCPECHVPMDQQDVPPRTDVAYVRDRILLVCPECHRNHVLDRVQKR